VLCGAPVKRQTNIVGLTLAVNLGGGQPGGGAVLCYESPIFIEHGEE